MAAERRQRAGLRAQLEGKSAEPIPPGCGSPACRRRGVPAGAARACRRGGVALFVVGAGTGWFASRLRPNPQVRRAGDHDRLAQGAVAAYRTFVVEVAHPVEVGVAQEAHLLQWLSKRLGQKLEAPDL